MSQQAHLPAFRIGDVRGYYPEEINEDFALRFAHAFVAHFAIKGSVAVGRDMRDSSVTMQDALQLGLSASGVNTIDLGLCATELGYFASTMPDVEAVIMVTASHNPPRFNGFKCVLHGGVGIDFETGLGDVMLLMQAKHENRTANKGMVSSRDYHAAYIDFLESQFTIDADSMGRIALNGLNGTASTLATDIAHTFELPSSWFRKEPGPIPDIGADPDNPFLRRQMGEFMRTDQFSLGVAWDGDCDRCVFFDGDGNHVSSYYMTALLADHILKQQGPGPIVFDTKVYWNLLDIIRQHGARPVASKTGHAFMKQSMKKTQALYGGERASHHYFRDFFYCDSGMYAWLKVVELIGQLDEPFGSVIAQRREQFSCTRELSLVLDDSNAARKQLRKTFEPQSNEVDTLDGIAFDLGHWRFSMRDSKTEACVRLNFEAIPSQTNLLASAEHVLSILEAFRGDDGDWLSRLEVE